MRTALITTTINVPTVLALYRKLAPIGARFFVAGDLKSNLEGLIWASKLSPCSVLSPTQQEGWKCSEIIGWNCIQRRNIALLEALKWGADLIYTVDDDNAPLSGYFHHPWNADGFKVSTASGWFDSGSLLTPPIKQRGFPVNLKSENVFEPIVDAKVGVVTGLILGDADMDAHTRVTNAPLAYSVHELAREGVLVDPKETWTPFNTQNTAYLRELAPAMFCAPGIGRHDDIFASLITQRIMRERDLFVHVGQPFVYQQRNQHDLLKDMGEELFGMSHILEFADVLNNMNCASGSVLQDVRSIYERLWNRVSWYPPQAVKTALAFLDDCESVL